MKKVLEAALVVAALAIGGFVVKAWLTRRAASRAPAAAPTQPGPDAEPGALPSAPAPRGVTGLPMIKLSSPPQRAARETAPPPPPPSR